MALSEEEQVKMFGETRAEVDTAWAHAAHMGSSKSMYVCSILSDVQETLARGVDPDGRVYPLPAERARQWLNKAKYLISK